MLCDLHIHTQCSDGTMTPAEAAAACRRAGVGLAAVCDHNTLAAWPAFRDACVQQEVACLTGVEIDVLYDEQVLHLLGYGVDAENAALLALLRDTWQKQEDMSTQLIERMSVDLLEVRPDDYALYERDPARGGWKGIDYLHTKGLSAGFPDVMKWYGMYEIPIPRYSTVGQAIKAVHAAGGRTVLAHPWDRLDNSRMEEQMEELAALGMDGFECWYPAHTPQQTDLLLDFCKQRGLLMTAGGDDHGVFASVVNGVRYGLSSAVCQPEDLNLGDLIDKVGWSDVGNTHAK